MKKLTKKLMKLFLPSCDKIAGYASERIALAINNQTEREDQIAKYAKLLDQFTDYQKFVTQILIDGRISDNEKEQIKQKLLPVVEYVEAGLCYGFFEILAAGGKRRVGLVAAECGAGIKEFIGQVTGLDNVEEFEFVAIFHEAVGIRSGLTSGQYAIQPLQRVYAD